MVVAGVVRVFAFGLLGTADFGVTGLVTADLAAAGLATGVRAAVDLLVARLRVTGLVATGLTALVCCPALA